jgi:hypothetical protein
LGPARDATQQPPALRQPDGLDHAGANAATPMSRIFTADDHELIRQGIRKLIEDQPG